jgi:hypothetical protein
MLGHWLCEGNNVISLIQEDAQVSICFEKNDTWRIDISNAKIVGDEIHFITTHFLRDGSSHPFNGTLCQTIIRKRSDDNMEMGMSTKLSPEYNFDILTKEKKE